MSADYFPDAPTKKLSTEDEDFPKLATRYLNRHFFLRRTPQAMEQKEIEVILASDSNAKLSVEKAAATKLTDRSELSWVGMEQEKGWLWLHFELQAPEFDKAREKLWLVHRVLLDRVDQQENTVAIDPSVSPKFSLQFRQGRAVQEFVPKLAEEARRQKEE